MSYFGPFSKTWIVLMVALLGGMIVGKTLVVWDGPLLGVIVGFSASWIERWIKR